MNETSDLGFVSLYADENQPLALLLLLLLTTAKLSGNAPRATTYFGSMPGAKALASLASGAYSSGRRAASVIAPSAIATRNEE